MLRKSLFIVIIGLLFACGGQDKSGVKLQPDTPVYDFARQLSEKLPSLDPDENNPLIKADNFTISTGEVIQAIYSSMGNRINQFQNLDADRLEQIVRQNATLLAERKLIMAEAEKAGLTVTQAEVDSMVRSLLSTFAVFQGGYIFSPDNTIMPDTPVENVWELFRCVREYGRR